MTGVNAPDNAFAASVPAATVARWASFKTPVDSPSSSPPPTVLAIEEIAEPPKNPISAKAGFFVINVGNAAPRPAPAKDSPDSSKTLPPESTS